MNKSPYINKSQCFDSSQQFNVIDIIDGRQSLVIVGLIIK